ncbi:MAG: hypothetical protein O7B99_00325 [Planctomycetota bacterium]|nr:hypothetical protein [Planctomycetota bacterium]
MPRSISLLLLATLASAQEPAPIYVTVFSHFDAPWSMQQADLDAFRQLSVDHPEMRWTHLWNPAAYTQSTPLLPQIEAYLVESRDTFGAEIGVHTHMVQSLVSAAGVAFQSGPSVSASPPACCCDGSGYAVPTSAYTYDEIRAILELTIDRFLEHGLCRPRSYCAGFYTTSTTLQQVLSDLDFTTSAAAFPWGTEFGPGYGACWDLHSGWDASVTHMTRPYRVSTTSILPGGPPPYLKNDQGPLLEIPQVCKIDWMVTAAEMKTIFLDQYAVAIAGTPTAVALAMHDTLAAGEQAKFDEVLDLIDTLEAGFGQAPVHYVTAAELRAAWLGHSGDGGQGAWLVAPTVVGEAQVSVSAGGTQDLLLDTCPPRPGERYVVLGSFSGTSPGIVVDGLTLPLAADAYFAVTFSTLLPPSAPPVVDALGFLDAEGTATARFELGAGVNPSFVGLTLHHAYAVLEPGTLTVTLVSNPVALQLVN